jgi:hypothetical protein
VQFDAINAEKQRGLAAGSILKKPLKDFPMIKNANATMICQPGHQATKSWLS